MAMPVRGRMTQDVGEKGHAVVDDHGAHEGEEGRNDDDPQKGRPHELVLCPGEGQRGDGPVPGGHDGSEKKGRHGLSSAVPAGRPGRAGKTSLICCDSRTSSGLPSATTLRFRRRTRLAWGAMPRRSWVTMRIATSRVSRSFPTMPRKSSVPAASIPDTGSSRRRISGSDVRARHKRTRCSSPRRDRRCVCR